MPAQALIRLLLDRDVGRASGMAREALESSGSRIGVVADLLQPAMAGVGDLWYRGEIGPSDELHAASIVAEVARCLPATPVARPVPEGSRLLLAALGEERHGIGMELLGLALQDEGWIVESLGPGTPPAAFLATAAARRPHVAAISASYMPSVALLRATISALRDRRIKVLVGGQAFNREHGLWRRAGADAYGLDARVGIVMARRLLPATHQASPWRRREPFVQPGRTAARPAGSRVARFS
jgi:methanogenic corrinoid protein MtbC1